MMFFEHNYCIYSSILWELFPCSLCKDGGGGVYPIIVDVPSRYFPENWKLWRARRDHLMIPDQKVSRLSSFLLYLMSHCSGSYLSMSGHFPGCPQAARPQCSYPVWCIYRKYTVMFVSCVVFIMSESTVRHACIKFCAKLKKVGAET